MLRIGIFFGGKSREREISFAGGRTVYDALDKTIFEPVPIFVDGLGNLVAIEWQYIYKGTIRDFYPPAQFVPIEEQKFQIYSESLGEAANSDNLLSSIGRKIEPTELKSTIDVGFLALHGPYGEDGFIQGLLDFYEIPYTGSGVFASAVGISKALQKKLMKAAAFKVNNFVSFSRAAFENDKESCFKKIQTLHFPVVVKASSQGSSIGVHFLNENNFEAFCRCVEQTLFKHKLHKDDWAALDAIGKEQKVRSLFDLQHGLGLPVYIENELVLLHSEAISKIDQHFNSTSEIWLQSIHGEHHIVVEEKLSGKEFSCIVVRDESGKSLALPPTEIRKSHELFDYRSKYLPGITRKVTPIEIAAEQIDSIRKACVALFDFFEFNVYARIDGFITESGEVFLNDPNTTSGMMPSSFFFHQAAEIGLSPKQFLTYIIHQSLLERRNNSYNPHPLNGLISSFEKQLLSTKKQAERKPRVGVIFGGYSSERHISVESGRNVFEKLNSAGHFETVPLFLSKDAQGDILLHKVPINLMLKDNADDISDKIASFKIAPVIDDIIKEAQQITTHFAGDDYDFFPRKIALEELNKEVDFAFLALHGRPGEDGTLQRELEKLGIPYNGSGPQSSATTIDKYQTNEILLQNGVLVAKHRMVWKDDWCDNKEEVIKQIEAQYGYPFIAKPADDGCSSAVKKIKTRQELEDFADAILRDTEILPAAFFSKLMLKTNEEFPQKQGFLIEELISPNGAAHFIEVTGGMLIYTEENGQKKYEVFEASEAVAEGGILSLEEKFLAGEGQNITPARYSQVPIDNATISTRVKAALAKTADLLNVEGYCRIDAFVRIFSPEKVEVIIIEINSLPGLTPATAIFHQAALANLKPAEFLEKLITIGTKRKLLASA
ncbi:D-alanine--D-alanine ligase [bacterium]|nr:D-alanine--D-alanine ligase [bacterium]